MIKRRYKSLIVIITSILLYSSVFGAVGTQSELITDNDCGCGNEIISTSSSTGLSNEEIAALQKQAEIEGWGYTIGENSATSRSLDQLCGLVVPDNWWVGANFDPCNTKDSLPDKFDWRDIDGVDYTTPVKDQGSCGSCWAFGTVGPLECNIKIKDEVTVDLSEQWLVSCNSDGYGCNGGWWAHEYHQWDRDPYGDTGAVLEEDFPYSGWFTSCNGPYPHVYTIDSWTYIGNDNSVPDVESLKQAILTYGPISAAVAVNSAFQGYSGGIFNGPTSSDVNHAIVLVGWDDNQGTDGIWFLRNSWGPGWGEDGYMRIEYSVCEVGYSACYIDYSYSDKQLDFTMHRIKMLDDIEWWPWDDADWAYRLSVNNGNYWNTIVNKKYSEGDDDHTEDILHKINLYTTTPEIEIKVWDRDDIWPDGPDLADISGYEGWGVDDSIPNTRGAIFHGQYDIINDELIIIDEVQQDDEYYVTSGEFDNNAGGEPEDGNDAKIWFKIIDNYEPEPKIKCKGSLSWTNIEAGSTVEGSFTVENIGDSSSELDWEITEWPTWGDWTFNPKSANGLKPKDGSVTVQVIVTAPNERNKEFTGKIKVINKENSSDYEIIHVSLATPKTYQNSNFFLILRNLLRNSILLKILNQIIF